MKKLVLIICSFIIGHCAFAQTSTEKEDLPFIAVEQMPEFPGGIEGLFQFLAQNVRYPAEARNANVQGKVFASFVVRADGTIRDVTIAKGIGYGCDEEVKRVVELMPKWKPGIDHGKAVPVRYSLPVSFTLTGQAKKEDR